MIASAKNTYDTQNTNIRQLGTNAVLVDQMLTKYGTGSKTARTLLREIIPSATAPRIWQENVSRQGRRISLLSSARTAERFYNAVEEPDARQRRTDLAEIAHHPDHHRHGPNADARVHPERRTRYRCRSSSCCVFWLVVIFASFSLFAEPGPIVIAVHASFRPISIERAVLDRRSQPPFQGLMQISNHHLRMVLPKIE